jgi:hypothetical protein
MQKEFKELVRKLEAQGWEFRQGSKHLVAYPADKSFGPIVITGTPGDVRSLRNLKAQLRRAGARDI